MTLTRAGAEQTAPFYDEPSVIRAFQEAGYYCAWLSNYGYHDHLLMRMADECRYMTYQPDQPDTALLVPFREAMAQPAQRHLCVLVTQGGHDSASLRQTPTLLRQLTDSLRTVHQPAMLVYIGHPTIRLTDGRQEMHGVVASGPMPTTVTVNGRCYACWRRRRNSPCRWRHSFTRCSSGAASTVRYATTACVWAIHNTRQRIRSATSMRTCMYRT